MGTIEKLHKALIYDRNEECPLQPNNRATALNR
jgi:hypothetical protein